MVPRVARVADRWDNRHNMVCDARRQGDFANIVAATCLTLGAKVCIHSPESGFTRIPWDRRGTGAGQPLLILHSMRTVALGVTPRA